MLKQHNKKGSAKELPVFVLIMTDCIRREGSRRGRGLGFGRRGLLGFRGWWSGSWGLPSVLEAADEGRGRLITDTVSTKLDTEVNRQFTKSERTRPIYDTNIVG